MPKDVIYPEPKRVRISRVINNLWDVKAFVAECAEMQDSTIIHIFSRDTHSPPLLATEWLVDNDSK